MPNRAHRKRRDAAPTVALETIAVGEVADVIEALAPVIRERLVPLRPRVVLRRPGRVAAQAGCIRYAREVRS